MFTKKPLTKTNLNLKIFLTSLFLIFIFSLSISTIATAATCGNGVLESGEECDFNSAFGPYPNQCANNGACNQATCTCSSGGGITPGTTPTPVAGPASFSADKTSGTTPLTVNFTLTNGTNCINYMCDTEVGTQTYVYEKSFSCTYNTAGTYTASISCNGNKITKTITVTGSGTGTTPTPTVTPTTSTTPTPTKPKPADVVSITNFYPRAPDNVTYYTFGNPIDLFYGYMPYFRGFIPPGTIVLDLLIIEGGKQMAVARHKIPPTGLPQFPPTGYTPYSMYTLSELEVKDQWTTETEQGSLYITHSSFYPLDVSRAGWLYVKVDGGSYSSLYTTSFSVKVDTKIYNAWWDKYIKDEAGWNKYIENVETYIDPTIEISPTPTPSPITTTSPTPTPQTPFPSGPNCNTKICQGNSCWNGEKYIAGEKTQNCATVEIKTSKTSLTAPDSSYITWNSTNASKLSATCTGLYSAIGSWYLNDKECKEKGQVKECTDKGYEMKFPGDKFGKETCTFYLTNKSDGLPGTPSSFEIEVKEGSNSISPTPTPNLCGNGKKDTGESCDPKSTTYDCAESRATCNAKCQCIQNPTPTPQNSRSCQRDNPDCEKVTCNNVYCNDGCGRIKGTRVCDGK
ncbi:MAG: hypothetical protein WCK16_01470 [Candidatus Moraniibacteriota bacterium]